MSAAEVEAPRATNALAVEGLDVAYRVRGTDRQVLRSVTFSIGRGESYGLVGESGCGKSTAALAIVRYLPRNGRVTGGSIAIDGRDLLSLGGGELRKLRATTVSMVYQDPSRALNPSIRTGRQVAEVFEVGGMARREAVDRAEDALKRVRISDPGAVMDRYPHQLSGGMQQRVVIAMALAVEPALLILDEPTTGLDATVEAEVLDLVAMLRQELSTSLLFISHNLGVIARMCDRVGVLYAGELVEEGPANEVFRQPRHPYTVGLLRCIPRRGRRKDHGRLDTIPGFLPALGADIQGCVFADRCAIAEQRCRDEHPPAYAVADQRTARCHFHEQAPELPRATSPEAVVGTGAVAAEPLIRLRELSKTFRFSGVDVQALRGVELDIMPGEILGLVGESGSGKTTLARVLLGLTGPDAGSAVELEGTGLEGRMAKRSRQQVKAIQIVFQNPDSALNRRHSVRRLIGRSLSKLAGLSGEALRARLLQLTTEVRLAERYLDMRPLQLSGGLKQRVAIARAFAGNPRLVVCDEPTSALDVSVQAAILNLLAELQRTEGVTYLFISHDLGVVRYLSDRIAVLYLGRLMELGPAESVFGGPHHPYTEALLSAVPSIDGERAERIRLDGEIPSAANPPSGCVFHTRCPRKVGEICEQQEPPQRTADEGHEIRCHIPVEELRRLQVTNADTSGAPA
ncbi:MAG: ABC transporter ATP-binding protein [Gaiellales bacterium]